VLCQRNSQRRCAVNFCKKYLVNDRMVARCGAGIRVEVVDRANCKVYNGELPDVFLEVRCAVAGVDHLTVVQCSKQQRQAEVELVLLQNSAAGSSTSAYLYAAAHSSTSASLFFSRWTWFYRSMSIISDLTSKQLTYPTLYRQPTVLCTSAVFCLASGWLGTCLLLLVLPA
jgi:hypothetical protein